MLIRQFRVSVMADMNQIANSADGDTKSINNRPNFTPANQNNSADYIAEAVWLEFNNIFIPTALMTSVLNMIVRHKLTERIDYVLEHLPGHPVLIGAIIRQLVGSDFDSRTLAIFESLFEKLHLGKTLIRRYKFGYDDEGNQSWRELAEIVKYWCGICDLEIIAVRDLERYLSRPARTRKFGSEMIELLESARDGESPYLQNDGKILFPSWAERRRQPRQTVEVVVTVFCDGATFKAHIKDISTHGLLLDRIFGLCEGATVGIEFDNGRVLDGIVVWTAGGRVGIELKRELAVADPLLARICARIP
jgi:PilZ domain